MQPAGTALNHKRALCQAQGRSENKQATAWLRPHRRSGARGCSRLLGQQSPRGCSGDRARFSSPAGCWVPAAHSLPLVCTLVSRPLLSVLYFRTEKVKNKSRGQRAGHRSAHTVPSSRTGPPPSRKGWTDWLCPPHEDPVGVKGTTKGCCPP